MSKARKVHLLQKLEHEIDQLIQWRLDLYAESEARLKQRLSTLSSSNEDDEATKLIEFYRELYLKSLSKRLEVFKTSLLSSDELLSCIEPPPATQASLAECSPLISRAYAKSNCPRLAQELSCLKEKFELLLEEAQSKSEQLSKLRAEAHNQTIQWYVSQIRPSLNATEERLREQVEREREIFKAIDGLSDEKWRSQSNATMMGSMTEQQDKMKQVILSNAEDTAMLRQRGVCETFIDPYESKESLMEEELQAYSNIGIGGAEFDEDNSLEDTPKLSFQKSGRSATDKDDPPGNQDEGNQDEAIPLQAPQNVRLARRTYHGIPFQIRDRTRIAAPKLFR